MEIDVCSVLRRFSGVGFHLVVLSVIREDNDF